MTDFYFSKSVPSILSIEPGSTDFVVGELAKRAAAEGKTGARQFKINIGSGDKDYRHKKFWIAPDGASNQQTIQMLSAEDVTREYLRNILKDTILPEAIFFGVPAVVEGSWLENYKKNIREIMREHGCSDVKFFYEPFAVFQQFKKENPDMDFCSKTFLMVDIGGGTFNTCVIRLTNDGNVSSSGPHGRPLGMISRFTGGMHVDKGLLERWVDINQDERGVPAGKDIYSDKDIDRLLIDIERVKIDISDSIKKSSSKSKKIHSTSLGPVFQRKFPKARLGLSSNDLKDVVSLIFEKEWLPQIRESIDSAAISLKKSNINLEYIDYIVVSGGGSQLPFLEGEIKRGLTQAVAAKNSIMCMRDIGSSVAKGLAISAHEESRKNRLYISGRSHSCLVGELFLGLKFSRADEYLFPKILEDGESGQIFGSAIQLQDGFISADFDMPSESGEIIFLGMFLDKNDAATGNPINAGYDCFKIPKKHLGRARISIRLGEGDAGAAKFYLQDRDGNYELIGEWDFSFSGDGRVVVGREIVGIDLGSSNSYIEKLFIKEEGGSFGDEVALPIYRLGSLVKTKLIDQVEKINRVRAISPKSYLYSKKNIDRAIYHSNKIELNHNDYGRVKNIFSGGGAAITKDDVEVKNLANAYVFILDNCDQIFSTPLQYIRELNRMVVSGLEEEAGSYRKGAVEIAGVGLKLPQGMQVELLMGELCDEIKSGPLSLNVLEFAVAIHTKFVTIHPFVDGNGRTGRLIVDSILMANKLPAVLIRSSDRGRYLDGLKASNSGDLSDLMGLYIDAFDEALDSVERYAEGPSSAEDIYKIIDEEDDPISLAVSQYNKIFYESLACDFDGFKSLASNFKHAVSNEIKNFNFKYGGQGFRISMQEYSEIDKEAADDILRNADDRPVWYFSLNINFPAGASQSFVFSILRDLSCASGLSIILGRNKDGFSYLQPSELIRFRRLFISESQTLWCDAEGKAHQVSSLGKLFKALVAELIFVNS